jgi:large subunit ribosomal protein L10
MSKILKQRMISEYQSAFGAVDGAVVVDYSGIVAEHLRQFRIDLSEKNLKFRVVRTALARQAFADTALEGVDAAFNGPSALVYGEEAGVGIAVAAAKAVLQFNKTRAKEEWMTPFGAINEGEVISAEGVVALSKMPDRDTMRGMIASAVQGAPRGLAVCLNNVGGGIARCLARKIEQAEEAGESAA